MKKALLITTVSGFIPQFEMKNVEILQSMGYEIHYASNYNIPSYGYNNNRLSNTGIIRHQIDFVRSPFRVYNNLRAFKQLERLMRMIDFDLVHCHTPMGSVLGRLAAYSTKTSPIIYTVHGFHFYKGASLINWLLYYPVESFLARITDVLITINKEDFRHASKFKIKGQLKYVPGVGIDYNKTCSLISNIKYQKNNLEVPEDAFIITSVGELNKNKNHEIIIRALAEINNNKIYYLICGKGELCGYLKNLSKRLKINNNIKFLGYREDVIQILKVSDIFIMPSLREGLSVSLMEAMSVGLPVICSNIRGNKDLIIEEEGGFLVNARSSKQFREKIEQIVNDETMRNRMGSFNKSRISIYEIEKISVLMKEIYKSVENTKI